MNPEYNEYYKVTDTAILSKFNEAYGELKNLRELWNDEAKKRGFERARFVNPYHGRLFESYMDGFIATREQMVKADHKVYKFKYISSKDDLFLAEVRKSNKKAFKLFSSLPYPTEFDGQKITSLFISKPNGTWRDNIGTINWAVDGHVLLRIVWSSGDREKYTLNPSLIRIKESEYLALQGKQYDQ